jgi:predicted metal-binding membrane protein
VPKARVCRFAPTLCAFRRARHSVKVYACVVDQDVERFNILNGVEMLVTFSNPTNYSRCHDRQGFERPSPQAFFAVSALLFVASLALTIVLCRSMSSMGEMPMPGGWTMSMAWMRMPGQSWAGAEATFVGMWSVMMLAMMLPSLVPVLWRYHQGIGGIGEKRRGYLTLLIAVAYFFVWIVLGVAVYPAGVTLATFEMREPARAMEVPILAGMVVLIAGLFQFTAWKARHLGCCREIPGNDHAFSRDAPTAWRHGLHFGVHCILCCASLTAILLIGGVMNLRTMAIVGAAITLERLTPPSKRLAQAIGVVIFGAGLFLILRAAAGFG